MLSIVHSDIYIFCKKNKINESILLIGALTVFNKLQASDSVKERNTVYVRFSKMLRKTSSLAYKVAHTVPGTTM